jgi:hypothetical protein
MKNKPLNILLYADVDMNLIDGSSIWLNSLIQVLAMDPSTRIHVLLKTRIQKDLLVKDLYSLENVTFTDPYKYFTGYQFENKNRLVVEDAIRLIRQLTSENTFDCLILRGLNLCRKAFATLENLDKVIPYITELTDMVTISEELKKELKDMYLNTRLMFLQTEEMKSSFFRMMETTEDKIAILPPMVQDFPALEPTFQNKNNVLVYVGKFSNDYYLYESLMAFRKITDHQYVFNIAGDKFHLDLKVPKEELIAMMGSIPGVNWMKGLDREDAANLIENSDLGLCWRSEVIDNERSMELSTKLLEYGRLGKPVLVRRIPIHERLLGADYPFYVNTEADLLEKITLAFSDPVLYEKAARKVYEVSLGHSFSHVSRQILPYLEKFRNTGTAGQGSIQQEPPSLLNKFSKSIAKLFR